jgi:hypothetical protein
MLLGVDINVVKEVCIHYIHATWSGRLRTSLVHEHGGELCNSSGERKWEKSSGNI